MALKPIRIFSHIAGLNPRKVLILLEELDLPYEVMEFPDFSTLHTPSFEKFNPNGRVPAIIDPNNNDFILWESGTILEYLVDRYDPDFKLHSKGTNDNWTERQYMQFQMSGQGPYFGQASWFLWFHTEHISSAVERYIKEIRRVTGVLDNILKGKQYFMGDKMTHVDIAFVPWYFLTPRLDPELSKIVDEKYPNFKGWSERMLARPAVKKIKAQWEENMVTKMHK
ncbi:glutathione S-transferase [Dactylonectria estremocensis]|uniref:Glutathione S-transferase n=1 Tax=Dactylonectria estremocensis TaxID=1079267 RepID=A0A9P9ILK3_9HYPO|nr:glutathione S-transferase [Dactylonectria estremocensis]